MKLFENIKILMSDQRGRALVKFGIYIIFIILVVSYVRGLADKKIEKKEVDSYATKTSYKEKVTFLDNTYELTYDSSIKFSVNNGEYEVKDDVVYKDGEEIEFDFYFWNLTPSFISNLVKNKEVYSETKYKDSSIEKTYEISLLEFIKSFKGKPLELDEFIDNKIIVKIKKIKDEVVSIYLDLTNYYVLFDEDIKLEVNIEY